MKRREFIAGLGSAADEQNRDRKLRQGESMTRLIAALILLTFATTASAGPKEDAFSVIEQFKKGYDASDPPSIVKLFAADSVFLGTLMQRPTRDKAVIQKYFESSASTNLPKKVEIENYEVLQISDAAVLFTGQNVFTQTGDGKAIDAPARFTFLITKGADGWRIAHFHSSRRPPPPQ
jgi:uncharacterized protein (TIGR02246 family)